MSGFDNILGKRDDTEKAAVTELQAAAAEPDDYRPFIIRPRAQVGFALVEANGTMHGFLYHTVRHPKHQVQEGEEFLSFHADGIAVVMQGTGLRVVFMALIRNALAELREYDGRPIQDGATRIIRLAIADTEGDAPKRKPPFELVKT